MRRNSYYTLPVAVCLLLCLCTTSKPAPRQHRPGIEEGHRTMVTAEQSIPADATVTILTCVETGDVMVHGWDRNEVRARSNDASRIELRRADATTDPNPATRVEVLIAKDQAEPARPGLCSNSGNLELYVPRGSTVQIKGNTGDIHVSDVAHARLKTLSGDIEVYRITKSMEVWSASGALMVAHSSGRVRLETISGDISASDFKTDKANDEFAVKSVSGDITLSKLAHTHVEATTSNSQIHFMGMLAEGGLYTFKSHSGNVHLLLPSGASFQLNAKVHHSGEIITDFPIRQVPVKASDNPNHATTVGGPLLNDGRLTGITGKGDQRDATLILSSFSGTVHLQRQH